MGGIISQLVGIKAQREQQAFNDQIGIYKTVYDQAIKDPDSVKPGTLEAAANAIGTLVNSQLGGGKGQGGGKAKGGGIGDLFKGMLTMGAYNIYKQAGQQQERTAGAVKDVESTFPKNFQLSPEEKIALKDKYAAAEAEEQAKLQDRLNQVSRANNQKEYEAALDRYKNVQGVSEAEKVRIANELAYKHSLPVENRPHNFQKQYIKVPGSDEVKLAYADPQNPGTVIMADSGEPAPEGWTVAAPPSGADARTAYAQLLRAQHDKYPNLPPDAIAKMASDEYLRKYGLEIGKTEQQIAINEVLSGIGGGAYQAKPPVGAAGTGGASPTSTAPSSGIGTRPAPQGGTGAGTGIGTGTRPSSAVTPLNDRLISTYLGKLLSDAPVSGNANAGVIQGREALKKMLGLGAVDFAMLEAANHDKRTEMADTIKRSIATQRINDVLNKFGTETVKRAKDALQTGSPLLNKPVRQIELSTVGDPNLRRFLLSFNAFQRQYTTLTSGGPLSTAMPHVETAQKVDEFMNPNMTLAEVIDTVDQAKIEGQQEQAGFKDAIRSSLDDISGSFGGSTSTSTGTPLPKPRTPGQRISKDQAAAYMDANGNDPEKAQKAAKADGWSF